MSDDIGKPTEAQLRLMEEFKASCQEHKNETLHAGHHKLVLMVSEDGRDITAVGGDYAPNPEGNDEAPIAFKHIIALQSELDRLKERNARYDELVYDRRILWDALHRILNYFPQIDDVRVARNIARQALGVVHHSGVGPAKDCVVNTYSSRVCERGTMSCNVKHGAPPTKE